MKFESPLISGTLLKRYKRFLADIRLPDGSIVTAHTANTGAMTGCCLPNSTVWLRYCPSPTRKYAYTWELIENESGTLTCINTARANTLVEEAIRQGRVSELKNYRTIRREVRYGQESSRIDLLLEAPEEPPCYVEVKNVTLMNGRQARFPDAVTKRGTKHLRELVHMVQSKASRSVIFYCIARNDASSFHPADDIDPEYGIALREAIANGVDAFAFQAQVSPQQVYLSQAVPITLD